MEIIEAYKCKVCGDIYGKEQDAFSCEFKHAQLDYANSLLKQGFDLGHIKYCCGFRWNLTPEQEKITTDNCFIVSHWQCCDKPAYRIVSIADYGRVKLWGKGGWMGYYGNEIEPSKLPKAYPKEDLFIYKG